MTVKPKCLWACNSLGRPLVRQHCYRQPTYLSKQWKWNNTVYHRHLPQPQLYNLIVCSGSTTCLRCTGYWSSAVCPSSAVLSSGTGVSPPLSSSFVSSAASLASRSSVAVCSSGMSVSCSSSVISDIGACSASLTPSHCTLLNGRQSCPTTQLRC